MQSGRSYAACSALAATRFLLSAAGRRPRVQGLKGQGKQTWRGGSQGCRTGGRAGRSNETPTGSGSRRCSKRHRGSHGKSALLYTNLGSTPRRCLTYQDARQALLQPDIYPLESRRRHFHQNSAVPDSAHHLPRDIYHWGL